jgi:hypothetical protein
MSIEGSDTFDDPYCYPGTTVLKNLLNIQDQDILDAVERGDFNAAFGGAPHS